MRLPILAFFSVGTLATPLASTISLVAALKLPRPNPPEPSVYDAQALAALNPYTHYASAAYCDPAATIAWSCGRAHNSPRASPSHDIPAVHCDVNARFDPVASGGDGGAVQYWYVGFDPALREVIVAHQGTDISRPLAAWVDMDVFLQRLDPVLFPGTPPDALVHDGFAFAQHSSARVIRAAVSTLLDTRNASSVVVVGHSLGAAIALLDALHLRLHLPPSITVRTIGYGMPRVGNAAFATFLSAVLPPSDRLEIARTRDLVPLLPPEFLGYVHPHGGRVGIADGEVWRACDGAACWPDDGRLAEDGGRFVDEGGGANGDGCGGEDSWPELWSFDLTDHFGPFDGVWMGCAAVAAV
ncbi:Alpha/Beta hydrolase protein [Vararia minispora EC-137]|uniref:Alpha/Beta hydrolase protein n=1 Tax=Vararia minispora EC-137 TaxID=1314806 RepID=A0ACB8QRK6_9AGAM|nr:Alpha/Beta hydrolase protein [Vararia minispora EC-137]